VNFFGMFTFCAVREIVSAKINPTKQASQTQTQYLLVREYVVLYIKII
jgi:hypothetical protein